MSAGKNMELRLTGKVQTTFKNVPKAFLNTSKIEVNGKYLNLTLWCPKANPKFDAPNLCFTISLGDQRVQIYLNSIMELTMLQDKINEYLVKHRDQLSDALTLEQDKYKKISEMIDKLYDCT